MSDLLSQLGIDWRLLLAQLVNFVILYLVLKKFLYHPVLSMLGERQSRITKAMADAKASERRREGVELERTAILKRADLERQALLERAAEEVEHLRRQRIAAAEKEAAQILNLARVEAERSAKELRDGIAREAGDMVVMLSRSIVGDVLTRDAHDQIIARAVKEAESLMKA